MPIQDFSNRLRRSKEFVGSVFISPGMASPRQMSPIPTQMSPKPSIFQATRGPQPPQRVTNYCITSQNNPNDHLRKMSFNGFEIVEAGQMGQGMVRSNSHIGMTDTKRITYQPEVPTSTPNKALENNRAFAQARQPLPSHFNSHAANSSQRSQPQIGLQQPMIARAVSNTMIHMPLLTGIPSLEPHGQLRERPQFNSFINGRPQPIQGVEACHIQPQIQSARGRVLDFENHRSMVAPPMTNKPGPLPTYALKESLANRIFKGAFKNGGPGDRFGNDPRRPIHR